MFIQHGISAGTVSRGPRRAEVPVDGVGGFLLTLVCGSRSEWVLYVLTAGEVTLEIDGGTVDLVAPLVISG